jgi:hypothetical protein
VSRLSGQSHPSVSSWRSHEGLKDLLTHVAPGVPELLEGFRREVRHGNSPYCFVHYVNYNFC